MTIASMSRIFLLAWLFAPASMAAKSTENYVLKPEKGLLAVSVSLQPDAGEAAGKIIFNYYRDGGAKDWFGKPMPAGDVTMDTMGLFKKATPDFENPWGKLVVLELQPGDYDVPGVQFFRNDATYQYMQTPGLTFKITGGRVTYLGNFNTVTTKQQTPFGWSLPHAISFELSDRSDRDLGILMSRYPKISREQITVALPDQQAPAQEIPAEQAIPAE